MSKPQRTVSVEPVNGHNALKMTWQHEVDEQDVHRGFQEIVKLMDQAQSPVDVVVDIRSKPRFPMVAVVSECLLGPASHARMGEWLVIGSNRLAEMIGGIVSRVSRRDNVHWFKTEDEVFTYLNARKPVEESHSG